MSQRKEKILTLNKQLVEFGLNPKDWTLIPDGKNRFRVQSLEDSGWCFLGWTKNKPGAQQESRWIRLQLHSL